MQALRPQFVIHLHVSSLLAFLREFANINIRVSLLLTFTVVGAPFLQRGVNPEPSPLPHPELDVDHKHHPSSRQDGVERWSLLTASLHSLSASMPTSLLGRRLVD
jgi:hypothetical protein